MQLQPNSIRAKVSGVTFENADGVKRQALLKRVQPGDLLEIVPTTSEKYSRPFYLVRHELGVIGTLKVEAVKDLVDNPVSLPILQAKVLHITGGDSEKPVLGCNIEVIGPLPTEAEEPATEDDSASYMQAMAFVDPDGRNIFHIDEHCSGMQNAKLVSFSHIKIIQARPCKRCAAIFNLKGD